MAPPYAPDRGEVVWLQFTPLTGSERAGHRPALVVSPQSYNRRVGLALVCPITTQVTGSPFEVVLPPTLKARGAILCDQLKSLDWRARAATPFDVGPDGVMEEVTAKILALVAPR